MPGDLSAPEPVNEVSFTCARCGAEAGRVQLLGPVAEPSVVRHSFTGRLTFPIDPAAFESVRTALLAVDVAALYAFNLELASFYCPVCKACYCGDHWLRWDVFEDDEGFFWHDSIWGRCPIGHERMLED